MRKKITGEQIAARISSQSIQKWRRKSKAVNKGLLAIALLLHIIATNSWANDFPPCDLNSKFWDGCSATLEYPGGEQYTGQWKLNKRHGMGTFFFTSGEKYIGEWKDGALTGLGLKIAADGLVLEEGIFDNYKLVRREKVNPAIITTGEVRAPMKKDSGTYQVSVQVNDSVTLDFVIDSGASDVTIPNDVVSALLSRGVLTDKDFLGKKQYQLADGSVVSEQTFILRKLSIGTKSAYNVLGSTTKAGGIFLLGQSFLSSFGSWSIDNRESELVLR
jgi:hypothetical protein